jgi:hypothetical protein
VIQKEIENRNNIRLALKSIYRIPGPLQAFRPAPMTNPAWRNYL